MQTDEIKFEGTQLSGLEADQEVIEAAEQSVEPVEEVEQFVDNQASEMDLYIQSAVSKYNLEFFKNFTSTGRDAHKHTQKNLEEYILNMTNSEDIDKLVLAMIT